MISKGRVDVPPVQSKMKQPYDLFGHGINSCDVRTFMIVARETGQAQVVDRRKSAMLFGDDGSTLCVTSMNDCGIWQYSHLESARYQT
jgi:hypothetical protein